MKKIIYTLLVLPFFMLGISCDDFLTEEPENSVTNGNFWKTEQDAESAIYGLHRLFRTTFGSINYVYRDRGFPFDFMNPSIWGASSNGTPVWTNSSAQLTWEGEYEVIAQCNLLIDNLQKVDMPVERYNFYLGQALCIRAYVYFYILKTWGDAPLIKESVDIGEKARTPWQELADFAIADLLRAKAMLPAAVELVGADGQPITSKQIPSKGTAWATLAHLYAWKASLNEEPELNKLALQACDSVIADGSYRLADNVEDVCEKVIRGNSPEGIFELDY